MKKKKNYYLDKIIVKIGLKLRKIVKFFKMQPIVDKFQTRIGRATED